MFANQHCCNACSRITCDSENTRLLTSLRSTTTTTTTTRRGNREEWDRWLEHEDARAGAKEHAQGEKVRQPFSFIIYRFTNINPTSSTLPTSPPTSALVPTTRPPGGLVLAKPTTPPSLSPLFGHLGGSILKHELSNPRFCKNDPSGGRSCKREGGGACVCKDDHPRPHSCKRKGGGACVCKDDHPRPRACKRKLPCPRVVFHSTQTRREGGPSPLCFSSQRGRPSAHSTTKRDNVNASIDHPRGIPFTLNNMPSSHVVFNVTRVLTYNLFIKCRLHYFVIDGT